MPTWSITAIPFGGHFVDPHFTKKKMILWPPLSNLRAAVHAPRAVAVLVLHAVEVLLHDEDGGRVLVGAHVEVELQLPVVLAALERGGPEAHFAVQLVV